MNIKYYWTKETKYTKLTEIFHFGSKVLKTCEREKMSMDRKQVEVGVSLNPLNGGTRGTGPTVGV